MPKTWAQEALLQIYRKLAWLRAPELCRPWALQTRRVLRAIHLSAQSRGV